MTTLHNTNPHESVRPVVLQPLLLNYKVSHLDDFSVYFFPSIPFVPTRPQMQSSFFRRFPCWVSLVLLFSNYQYTFPFLLLTGHSLTYIFQFNIFLPSSPCSGLGSSPAIAFILGPPNRENQTSPNQAYCVSTHLLYPSCCWKLYL